jgi:hypothetical protein
MMVLSCVYEQAKLNMLTDWDRFMDERDRKLAAKAAAEAAAAKI